MTHQEMLNKLGLTDTQFQDLLKKHSDFIGSLDSSQRRVMRSFSAKWPQIVTSFGQAAKPTDLQRLLKRFKATNSILFTNVKSGKSGRKGTPKK